MKPADLAKLEKNIREKDIEEVEDMLCRAKEFTHTAQIHMAGRRFEDAYPDIEEAEACLKVALRHMEDLL